MRMNKTKSRKGVVRVCRVTNGTKKTATNLSECIVVPHQKGKPNKSAVIATRLVKAGSAKADPIRRMNLDEMLEASNMVQMGIAGEELPFVTSPNAQKYARTVLALNRREDTKPAAVEMIDNLNAHIMAMNKKTTNATESKRLYWMLMGEK